MQKNLDNRPYTNKLRILFCIVLFEYGLFIFSGVSFSFLNGNHFFSIGADPVFWIFYLLRIPKFIAANQWFGIMLDVCIVLLILLIIRNPFQNRFAIPLFFLLLLFNVTLMGQLAHRNYQVGFFMVFVPFLFNKEINRNYAFEFTRYFLLFFYVSAAVLKWWAHALSAETLFSHLVSNQFTPYFLESNTGLRTDLNLYLTGHPAVSHLFYLISFVAELSAIVGFFTKRFDKWIAILILAFHFSNWFIMDIAPFGQIAFICLLFLGKEMRLKVA